MEAARTSETSVDIQLRTRQYIPEDSELYFHETGHWGVLLNFVDIVMIWLNSENSNGLFTWRPNCFLARQGDDSAESSASTKIGRKTSGEYIS
jgi:hypothetical protein